MVKRFDYHDEDRFAFGLPIHESKRPRYSNWAMRGQLASALGGVAATSGALAYNAMPSASDVKKYVVGRVADAALATGAFNEGGRYHYKLARGFYPQDNPNRFERRLSKISNHDPAREEAMAMSELNSARRAGFVGKTEPIPKLPYRVPRVPVRTPEFEMEVDEPVLVEAPSGRLQKLSVRTYGHDADDLGDLRGSGVYVNGAEVTKSTLSSLSLAGDRPVIGDDGEGAVLVKLPNGKVVWQVGVFRYPVQYMGKKICPFSFSSGRYSQVKPSVNVPG